MTLQIPKLQAQVLLVSLASSLSTFAKSDELPAYAAPDYSKRFIENSLAPILDPGKTIHVSISNGDDANDGSKEKPLKTLTAARDAVRAIKSDGLPPGGVEILVAAGQYRFSEPSTSEVRTREPPKVRSYGAESIARKSPSPVAPRSMPAPSRPLKLPSYSNASTLKLAGRFLASTCPP